jgi:hemolysin activation/secretion protein
MSLTVLILSRVAFFLLSLLAYPVFAAESDVSPGSLNKSLQETSKYYELLKKERDDTEKTRNETLIEKKMESTTPETEVSTRTVLIEKFDVSPSAILTPEQITEITDRYLYRELNINQLMGIVNEINKLYATEARVIARAVLPKQKVTDGVVKIQLIEARLGKLQVEGNVHTHDSFIKDRVLLQPGDLITLNVLTDNLITFNRWNDMSLKASLVPGQGYGTTDVLLIANEGEQYILNVFADNAGSWSVGEDRIGISTQVSSLLGYRDRLFFSGTFSEGSENVSISYDIPVHRSGTRLGLSSNVGDIEIIEGPLKVLNITGDSTNTSLTLVQPIDANSDYDWDVSLAYLHKTSDSFFDGVKLVSTTADDLVLGTNLRFFDQDGTWLTSHSGNIGRSDSVKGRDYYIYSGSLIRLQYFENGSSLIFRNSLQLSDTDDLPSFNQIAIGGTATVRGYSEGLLSGDMGYTLSTEYAYPLGLTDEVWVQRSNLFVFLDHGAAFPFRGDGASSTKAEDYLTSVGVGLDFDVIDSLLFKLSVGFPLKHKTQYNQDSYRISAILNWTAAI